MRVIPLGRYRVHFKLWCVGVAATLRVDLQLTIKHAVVATYRIGVIVAHPLRIMQLPNRTVRRKLHVVEATMRVTGIVDCFALIANSIFCKSQKWIK